MRRSFIFLTISALMCLSFFSCKPKTIETTNVSYAVKLYLTNDTADGALAVDIKAEIPNAFHNQAVLDSIRATVISYLFGNEYVSLPNDSLAVQFASLLYNEYKANNEQLVSKLDSKSTYTFNNEHTLEGFSLLNDKQIYSYGIERYVYMGGAHGLMTRTYLNFNLKTGKLITESDLFIDDYKSELTVLIKKKMVEDIQNEKDTEAFFVLEDTDYWTDSIKPNGNFYITDESINYVFNPYEIAPYYLGQTEVILPFDRIKDLLRAENPILYLMKTKEEM